jgi:hypothetical protein
MDHDFDLSPSQTGGRNREAATSHFLDSLGLGEEPDEAVAVGSAYRPQSLTEDEGVVLSSLPEDFEVHNAAPARSLAMSFSVSRGPAESANPMIEAISAPEEDGEQNSPVAPPSSPTREAAPSAQEPSADSPDAVLHLRCPECEGSLVLKHEHLGIEGMCVWCKAPIVATESGRDRRVKVFRLFGDRTPESDTAPVAAAAPTVEINEPTLALPLANEETPEQLSPFSSAASSEPTPASAATFGSNDETAPFGGFGFLSPEPQPSPAPEPIHSAPEASFGFLSPESQPSPAPEPIHSAPEASFGFLSPEPQPSSAPEPIHSAPEASFGFFPTEPAPSIDAPPAPLDLEALYDSGGFVPPSESPTPASVPSPFGPVQAKAETALPQDFSSAFPEIAPTQAPSQGFGAFLEGAAADLISSPASFLPSAEAALPWGPPSPSPPPAPTPAAPISPLAQGFGFPTDAAPSAFGMPTPQKAVAAPFPAPSETGDGFSPAPISAFSTGSAFASDEPPSSPLSDAPPSFGAAFPVETESDQRPLPFASPTPDFASAKPSASEGSAAALFAEAATPMPWGSPPHPHEDEAPKPLGGSDLTPSSLPQPSPLPESPLAPAPDAGTGLFGELAAPARPSLFDTSEAAPPSAPAPEPAAEKSASPPPTAASIPAPNVLPTVVSQPLSSGKKPVVRKGFVVLMVTILGFASGAALASFVLPVDRYVASARSYLEAKLGVETPSLLQPLEQTETTLSDPQP